MGTAYRNVVVNDLVLDAEGQKMSKSRGNVVDPWAAIEAHGADAIRWYLMTVSVPWVPKRFDPAALSDAARRTFDTLANTYRFFALYANLEAWSPSERDGVAAERTVLDRWVLSSLDTLAASVRADLESYELTRAARAIGDFINNDVSNWYVRRSRDRFWGSADHADARAAFATLQEVLVTTARLLAPFTPFHADWLHRALASGTSAHLAEFPGGGAGSRADGALEQGMADVRELARLGRAARERVRIRVRQPLAVMHAVAPGGRTLVPELLEVLKDELNVKQVRFLAGAESLVTLRAQPNFRVLGKRFGSATKEAAEAIRGLQSDRLAAFRRSEPLEIEVAGETAAIGEGEFDIIEEAGGELLVESDGGYTVALDTNIDAPLRIEGIARELVNRIQRLRREVGLHVADRIRVRVDGPAEVLEAVRKHHGFIAGETLAVELVAGGEIGADAAHDAAGRRVADGPGSGAGEQAGRDGGTAHDVDLDGVSVRITLERAVP
jgi:isoleucyl-tRNA synthetase